MDAKDAQALQGDCEHSGSPPGLPNVRTGLGPSSAAAEETDYAARHREAARRLPNPTQERCHPGRTDTQEKQFVRA